MTWWTYAPKEKRWRMRRNSNLDFNERKYGLQSAKRYGFLKEAYFRLARDTGNARYFGLIMFYPIIKMIGAIPKDPEAEAKTAKLMKEADDHVKNNIPVDPLLGNPEISAENLGALISSNYGFESMIELISLNKKSNEFWESMCYKVDSENDGEKWHDYQD
jgi:hypothetical protein